MTLPLEYVAGLLDADGCVTIIRAKRGDATKYCLRVDISNCYAPVLIEIRDMFGGSIVRRPITQRKARDPNELGVRDTFTWITGARIARRFLNKVLPFLVIKRAEAVVAVEFQSHMSEGTMAAGFTDRIHYREHLASLCSSLKRQRYDLNGLPSVADLDRLRVRRADR